MVVGSDLTSVYGGGTQAQPPGKHRSFTQTNLLQSTLLSPSMFNKMVMSLTDVANNAQTKGKDKNKHPAQNGNADKTSAITVHSSTNFSQHGRCISQNSRSGGCCCSKPHSLVQLHGKPPGWGSEPTGWMLGKQLQARQWRPQQIPKDRVQGGHIGSAACGKSVRRWSTTPCNNRV